MSFQQDTKWNRQINVRFLFASDEVSIIYLVFLVANSAIKLEKKLISMTQRAAMTTLFSHSHGCRCPSYPTAVQEAQRRRPAQGSNLRGGRFT